jgi:hypothetical protein
MPTGLIMRIITRTARAWAVVGLLAAAWLWATGAGHAQAPPPPSTGSVPESVIVPPGTTFLDPGQLPLPTESAPAEGDGTASAGGDPAPGGDGAGKASGEGAGKDGADPCAPWWKKGFKVTKFPLPGNFLLPPTGPGYYSLLDWVTDHYRQKPPKYPYPRFCIFPFSFFDVDWSYLDDPKNEEHDFFDFLKRIHLGDNFLFTTGGEFRYRHANEIDSRLTGRDNTYDLTRVRAYGDLWYRDRVRIFAEFIDADTFNQDLPPLVTDRNHGDFLNLFAEVKLFDLNKNPVYFRGGRQELLYGSQRLISPLDWANDRRTFQGGKLFYRGDKLDVDLFLVQPIVPDPQHFDSVDNEQVFTGLWTAYRPRQGQFMDFYYLDLDNTRPVARGRNGVVGGFNVNTFGSRYAGYAGNLLFDFEGMLQFGGFSNQSTLANAYTGGLGWSFKDVPMKPQVWLYYDSASGDRNPGQDGTHRTFNQLFPFNHYYLGSMDLVGRQNIHDLNAHLYFYPTPWITTILQYHVFRLDEAKDALYNSAGVPIRLDPTGRAGTNVGDEINFVVNFHLGNHSDVFVQYSHLYAGDFIQQTGPPGSPDYLYLMYTFRW